MILTRDRRQDKVREWYAKGVQWMEQSKRDDAETKRFRAQAARLLGVEEKK